MRARRAATRLVAVAVASVSVVATTSPAPSSATQFGPAQYWQHIGYSFEPCAAVQIRPNLERAREPAQFRALLDEAIDVWNGAIGRDVLSRGPDTTASARNRLDGINTLEVITQSTSGVGGAGGPTTEFRDGSLRIVEADMEVIDFDGLSLQTIRDTLLLTMVHEIGHGLGFRHTVDPDSPMSYAAEPGPTMDVDTAFIANHLLAAPCGSSPRADSPYDFIDDYARDKRIDFQHVSRIAQPLLAADVDDVVLAGVSLAHSRMDLEEPVRRALICRDDVFADCLAGSSLAARDGIILYVPGGRDGQLPESVARALDRAFPAAPTGDVIILGGPNAVSVDVEDDLRSRGYPVRRFADTSSRPNRYGTAAVIAREVVARTGDASTVLLARGDDPADAMTVGVHAARDARPLVLTPPGQLSDKTRAFLTEASPSRVVILGGPAAVGAAAEQDVRAIVPSVDRARGRERTATSVAIARDLLGYTAVEEAPRPLTLLNGRHPDAWALALAFAPLGALQDSPILLTQPDGFLPATLGDADNAPGSGRFLADLDLAASHDGGSRRTNDPFLQLLGSEVGAFTPMQALDHADQILLFCRWYRDDCEQEQIT